MTSINTHGEFLATAELLIPRPVIIFTGMDLQQWKQCFTQKMGEATSSTEKALYNKCVKLLIWAEFCNAAISYAGNSKDNQGNLTVKFTFSFPDDDCKFLFLMEWESMMKIVAK